MAEENNGAKIEFKKYELKPLPYALDALEPYINKDLLDIHYNGHHKGYVTGANNLLTRYEKIVKGEESSYDLQGVIRPLIFNVNGNKLHTMFWNNMATPGSKGGGKPGGKLADMVEKQYGSFDKFKKAFTDAANSLLGTGWTVLYYDKETGNLQISTVENHFMNHIADMPVLLIVDEFEHAYYLQYKNKRVDFITAWWNLINWSDAENTLRKFL
ncbi:MAG: superoxide dismutase [Candidatus Micrarchaeaceae archaeon]